MDYKRNQVEDAIARLVQREQASPSPELRIRFKRLLETDRALGRNKRSRNPARGRFAFHGTNAPGRGVDNRFSEYEAFALLTALRLMQHGWTQQFAVAVLRRVRSELEKNHKRILQQDPVELFNEEQILKQAKPGDLAVSNTDPVFLVIVRRGERDGSGPIAEICRGQQQSLSFARQYGAGQAWTMFELVNSAHALHSKLIETEPRRRGRGP